MPWFFLIIVLAVAPCPAWGQEFYVLGGVMHDTDTHDHSYSWQLEYMEGLSEHFAFSFLYMNEGHVPSHHRDGNAIQLWARTNVFDPRFSLAAGAGPYYYFDTTNASTGDSYSNNHGWGTIASLAATWYTPSGWLFRLRTNWVWTDRSIDSLSAVIGIGYQLDAPTLPGPRPEAVPQREKTAQNELTMFAGRTIVNSFDSEASIATSIEYRRGLWRYMDWTVSWLYEGDNGTIRRNGLITQLWVVRPFFEDRLVLGLGGGAYFAVDERRNAPQNNSGGDDFASGIVTMTGSYRFHPHWDIRAVWHRIITNSNRDSDVILGGIGYRF